MKKKKVEKETARVGDCVDEGYVDSLALAVKSSCNVYLFIYVANCFLYSNFTH